MAERPEPRRQNAAGRALASTAAAPAEPGSPLLSNVVFEVQGPINGPTLGFLGNQYYLSSTIEWTGLNQHGYSAGGPASSSRSRALTQKSPAQTWKPASSPANATRLSIGDDDELPLRGVESTVWVDGLRARVLLDCVYDNDRDQQLEGKFKLRLPEGARPYYLAFGEEANRFDAGEKLGDRSLANRPEPESILGEREERWRGAREARMVPRKKAATAFRNTVRRSVDPALLEWAGAGIFQARVFPLLPRTTHRIVVGYEVDLVALPGHSGDYEFTLALPDDLPALSLDLHVLAPQSSAVEFTPKAAARVDGARRSFHFADTDERVFQVRLHDLGESALAWSEDSGFFAMDLSPELEAVPVPGSPAAVFLVDSSLSSSGGSYPIWLDLMEAILAANSDSIQEFAVLFFDVAPRWWRAEATLNTPAARAALREYAESLALEGASDLGAALCEASAPSWLPRGWSSDRDLFLLSDGNATWGESDVRALAESARRGQAGSIYAYTTGLAGTSVRTLTELTRSSGGAMFSVNGAEAIGAAAVAHQALPWRIESVRAPGVTDLLLRGLPTAIYPGQTLRVVGRGVPVAGSSVELALVRDGERKRMRFPIEACLETPLAVRAYGEVATDQLEELGRPLAEAAQAFATRFRVPGKSCSLLMLESEDDYLEQGVLPAPAVHERSSSWPALEVEAALAARELRPDAPVEQLLEQVDALVELDLLAPLGDELLAELRELPPAALEIAPERLRFEALLASQVEPELRAALESGEPDYRLLRTEATRRAAELALGDAVRIASSLVELNPGDAVFARDVAQTLAEWGLFGHAYHLHRRVAELRPTEPDSYLALGRCAAEAERPELALFWFTLANRARWAGRYGGIHRVAAFETVNYLRGLGRADRPLRLSADLLPSIDALVEQVGLAEADLAVVIQWNTQATDIDLHVFEPGGAHCYFSNPATRNGGRLSADVTQGFGPELYLLERAPAGTYDLSVTYYSGDQNRTQVQSRVLATVVQGWGTSEEVTARRQIELDSIKESKLLARLTLNEESEAPQSSADSVAALE